jgi:hypothetical protein
MYYQRIQKTYLRQRWPRKEIALLVSKQAGERTLVLLAIIGFLALLPLSIKLARRKILKRMRAELPSLRKDKVAYLTKLIYTYSSFRISYFVFAN